MEGYDIQKLGKLLNAQCVITGNVAYGEREVTYNSNRGVSPLFVLGFLYPPLFLAAAAAENTTQTERVGSTSITVKALDVETGKLIASGDIIGENAGDIDLLSTRLYGELIKQYPIEGTVLEADNSTVMVDTGTDRGLKEGDILFVYKPSKSIKHPKTGEMILLPEQKIGEVRVKTVMDNTASAVILTYLTKEDIKSGYTVKLFPIETLTVAEIIKRMPQSSSRPYGMGECFIGQATGADALKYNPAGLAQTRKTELNIGWGFHSSTYGLESPNTGDKFTGIPGSNSDYQQNALYPSKFNCVIPTGMGGIGLTVNTANLHMEHKAGSFDFLYDDGGLNIGLGIGANVNQMFMYGIGLEWNDRWIGIHRTISGADKSYEFRGNSIGYKIGGLLRPVEPLGIGFVYYNGGQTNGELQNSVVTPKDTHSYSIDPLSYIGLGMSYNFNEKVTLNLDLLDYMSEAQWYDTRLGIEYAINKNYSLRAGMYSLLNRVPDFGDDPNYPTSYDIKRNVLTAGLGYNEDSYYWDFAAEYSTLADKDILVLPDPTPGSQPRTLLTDYSDIYCKITLGFRF